MKCLTRFAVLLGAATLVSACTDAAPPTEPEVSPPLQMQMVTAQDLSGLFFFGPPVGESEDPEADFDPTQLPVVVFEICLEDDLEGGEGPLTDLCPDPLGRWTADGGPGGAQIVLVQGGEDDWYQVDVPFGAFDRSDLEVEKEYVGRVILGDPDGETGTDFEVLGAFEFVLAENQGGGGPNADPMQVVWDRTLPVKWFLGEGAASNPPCGPEPCTVAFITAEDGGELCFPEGDCESDDATAGVSIQPGVLPHDIVLTIADIDLGSDPNPLNIPNPQIEEAVDISATPAFDDLPAFDNNDDGIADIAVQLCYFTADPDNYATYRGTDDGAERLPFDPRGDFIFDTANCELEPVPPIDGAFLEDGLLGRMHRMARAGAGLIRPVADWLGPQPLRAGDISFTADARGFSPFVPALVLDLAANEEPAPLVVEGETVTISVCVEGAHPGIDTPTPEEGVDVTFQTADGSVEAMDQFGSSVTVPAELEAPTADCVNQDDPGGQVAVARASWTVPGEPGDYEARAFLDGDFVVSVEVNQTGTYTLEEEVIEVVFGTEAQAGIAVADIAPGDRHTCAVSTSDPGLCWGQNNFGQLGDGNEPTNSDRPVFVSSQLAFTDISAWGDVQDGTNDLAHSCAVSAGDIWCWGRNASGQLGDGTTNDSDTPVQVDKPTAVQNFVSVSTGFGFTCAIDDGSRVWCWGRNTSGELGINEPDVSQSLVPVQVVSQTFFDSMEAGSGHACALTKDFDLYCWGANNSGQVGDGTTDARFAPVFIDGGIADVSAGEAHTCAVTTADGALCWGDNGFDQLGDGTGADQSSPAAVQNPAGLSFFKVSAGGQHSCSIAFTAVGQSVTVCWGANFSGQLGDGSIVSSDEPVLVDGGLPFREVEAGIAHTCGFTFGGGAYCWGLNDNGQVGNGDTGVSPRLPTPVLPPAAPPVVNDG